MNEIMCGVDLGGTKLAVGLVKRSGELLDKVVVYDHRSKQEEAVIGQIRDMINGLLEKNDMTRRDLLGIGVGFPGHIRSAAGTTILSSNLAGFRNFPLREEIEKYFDLTVITENDANAQGYAEFKYGAGRGYKHLIFVTISSGIGAGIIIDERIYRGVTGTAGEVGHMIIEADSEAKCGCGNYGCLMSLASGLAIARTFKNHLKNGMQTRLEIDQDTLIDGKVLKKGLEIDDPLTKTVVDQFAKTIGTGLYNLFQLFNIPVMVLGGGLMNLGDYFLEQIKKCFFELSRDILFEEAIVCRSQLKEDAGIVGAASLLLEENK